jgi:hypothetical protein
LARVLGRSAEARQHFERALSINRALEMPVQLAKTQRELTT